MSLNTLPNELIECIAINLNYIDLCNLLQVNSRLNSYLSNFNALWQQALCKQWPILYEEVFNQKENKSEINWRFETIQCHLIGVNVYKELCRMSTKYYQKQELSDSCFDCLRDTATQNQLYCAIDELEIIINSCHKEKHNLTVKFYARKALRSLRSEMVRKKWTKMVRELNYNEIERDERPVNVFQPEEHDIPGDLISGSVLLAQYFQPYKTISETKIRQNIRSIALKAVVILREKNSKNSLITQRHGKLLTNFEASHLTESVLSSSEDCVEAIHALNFAMFEGSSRFCGNVDAYYVPINSYIDKVLELKSGIPILLCVLYQAAAALLGVKLYPISNPGHFMLAIRDKLHFPELHKQFTYIDPFNSGKLSDQPVNVFPTITPNYSTQLVMPARPLSVFLRMASNLVEVGRREMNTSVGNNIMRNGLELVYLINQENPQNQLSLAQVYLSMDINHEFTLRISNQLQQRFGMEDFFAEEVNRKLTTLKPPIEFQHRRKLPELQFAVGMVMRHLHFKYTCVVYGWDGKCAEKLDWIEQKRLKFLSKGEKQPFYRVLLDDESTRYTAQENLAIEWNPEIGDMFHSEIGRHFNGFNGRYFELNDEMRARFPDDERVRDEIYVRH